LFDLWAKDALRRAIIERGVERPLDQAIIRQLRDLGERRSGFSQSPSSSAGILPMPFESRVQLKLPVKVFDRFPVGDYTA